ncbi:MAG: GntR family transcriptional regulator [Nocardioidaceae bacterium]
MYESLSLEHTSTVERAAESLRQALFAGDLTPGTPLRELAIADQLGIARSTVREALTQLATEGLATRIPNRGVVVSSLDPEQIHDVVRARLALETSGARAWPGASEEGRDAVRRAMADYRDLAERGASARDITEAHLVFHRSLVALTGSTRLVTVSEQIASEIRLALAHLDRLRSNAIEQVAEHQALLDRLEAGDAEGVARALVGHLAGAEQSLRESLLTHDDA